MEAGRGTRVVEREGVSTLVLDRFEVEVIEGPDAGKVAQTSLTPLRLGSADDCGLVLSDPTVSASHCELRVDEGGLLVRDLKSTNGTFAGSLRLGAAHIPVPTQLRLGDTRVEVRASDQTIEMPMSRRTSFGALLGHSPAMRAAFAVLERAAKSDVTVLVEGESGTGKELAARALHQKSPRSEGPYVVFDCGAVSENLIESELFGHKKGAFTGAIDDRVGAFEQAHGGTLVLDELGELPLDLQPKLLRALEGRVITRVGDQRPRAVDLRLVASTNRDLEREVAAGRFRQDLYFRLAVLVVRLPPLRDRREEIPRLLDHFLNTLGSTIQLPTEARQVLEAYDWPGNVRELRNVVERFVTLPDLGPEHWLPGATGRDGASSQIDKSLPFHEAKARCIDSFERAYLEAVLREHGENVSEAARVAGLSRQSCYRLMAKHGLSSK